MAGHRDERELGTAYSLARSRQRAAQRPRPRRRPPRGRAKALRDKPDPERRAELVDAAGVFLGEALSTFEIAHRGYREVQEVARLEHEHVMQLRSLADASVRITASLTTEEVLQLTVEAARSVLGAQRATITSSSGDPYSRGLSAASRPWGRESRRARRSA